MRRILWIGGREVTPADCRKIGCDYDKPNFNSAAEYWYIRNVTDCGTWGGVTTSFSEVGGRSIYKRMTANGYYSVSNNSTLLTKDPRRLP